MPCLPCLPPRPAGALLWAAACPGPQSAPPARCNAGAQQASQGGREAAAAAAGAQHAHRAAVRAAPCRASPLCPDTALPPPKPASQPADLHDDQAAAVVRRQRLVQLVAEQGLVLCRAFSSSVGAEQWSAAREAPSRRRRLVTQTASHIRPMQGAPNDTLPSRSAVVPRSSATWIFSGACERAGAAVRRPAVNGTAGGGAGGPCQAACNSSTTCLHAAAGTLAPLGP